MIPSVEGWPTKAKEALSPHEVRLIPLDTSPVFLCLGGKSLKDYLVRAILPRTNETRRCETCAKKTCLVCNLIRTITTFIMEACNETFKIQSGTLNCNLEKVLGKSTIPFEM